MDGFQIGVLVAVAIVVAACCLAARASSTRRRIGVGGARRSRAVASSDAALDAEDLRGMLAATNARRRARGLPERSLDDAIREFGGD